MTHFITYDLNHVKKNLEKTHLMKKSPVITLSIFITTVCIFGMTTLFAEPVFTNYKFYGNFSDIEVESDTLWLAMALI